MTETTEHSTESRFSAENEDLLEYRELSRLAIAAMVLGVLSVLSIFTPVLWILPVLAIILGLVSYFQITRSEVLTGKGMALAGIGLAAIWLGIGVTQGVVRDRIMRENSRVLAQAWLDMMLEGKILESHQLTLSPQGRQPASASLEGHYQNDQLQKESLEGFKSQEFLEKIQAWNGGPLESKFVADEPTTHDETVYYGRHLFDVIDKDSGERLWQVQVMMKRQAGFGEEQNVFHWVAGSVSVTETYPAARK
ncbi:DUF4190 domain-containing protein [Bremerella cremea]|uniref:DUF4190 domain-containing protein n=1 Tax=Bremerella cremea TaxID=1031537 RepID=UPI0031EE6DDA